MRITVFLLVFLISVFSCSLIYRADPTDVAPHISPDSTIAIQHVNIISVEREGVDQDQTLVISGGRIVQYGPTGSVSVPDSAVVMDGSGYYLMPGLLDMHVHAFEDDFPAFLSHGVTTVRNMWGSPRMRKLVSAVAAGTVIGPEIISASPGIDGIPPSWPFTQTITDPEEALPLVQRLKEEGWSFLKVYNQLDADVYTALAEAARSEDIPFSGHAPRMISVTDVMEAGQSSIEHFTGYDHHLGGSQGFRAWYTIHENRISDIAIKTAENNTGNCPTLVALDVLTRRNNNSIDLIQQAENNRFKLLLSLYKHEAPLLIGTDAGIDLTVAGTSLHTEMNKFVQAGIPPSEVIGMATLGGARFLGVDDRIGSIAVGKEADLVLLRENPLENVANISSVEGVFLNGGWYPATHFQQ